MAAFLYALFFVFIAEMGDKTQLVALAFATRFRASVVLSGVFVATLLVHLFSVGLGQAAGLLLPIFWVNLLAGLAFIGFGIWSLRGDKLEDEEKLDKRQLGPFMTVAVTFFLAELGDKTMLATITIASQQANFIAVWLGSTVGMVVADGLAIVIGQALGHRLPERFIQYASALLFIGTGLYQLAHTIGWI